MLFEGDQVQGVDQINTWNEIELGWVHAFFVDHGLSGFEEAVVVLGKLISFKIYFSNWSDSLIDMETIEVGNLEVLLMTHTLNAFIDWLDLFLAFLVLEVEILHLVQNKEHSVVADVMDVVEVLGCTAEVAGHFLLFHGYFEFHEAVFDAL